jgi:hypothetical protein
MPETFRDKVGLVFGLLGLYLHIGFLISCLVFVVVGSWDLIVWLTNANWKTTHFTISMYAIAIGALCYVASDGLIKLGEVLYREKNSN